MHEHAGPLLLRVAVRELVDGRLAAPASYRDLHVGDALAVGREGLLRVGVEVPDDGISRTALTVTAGEHAWHVRLTNRNAAMLHPWALAPEWLPFSSTRTLRWPRTAIRLIGKNERAEHWVLLEADAYALPDRVAGDAVDGDTRIAPRPRTLTASQLTAVYATFPEHLAWPPVMSPATRSLEAVAHRLGVTPSAVRERLRPVQDRARELGLSGQFGLTEPDYVHHLAAQGYLSDVPPAYDGSAG